MRFHNSFAVGRGRRGPANARAVGREEIVMRTSRRRFLGLAAALSALAGTAPAALARTVTRRRPGPPLPAKAGAPAAALAAEIEKQKKSVARALAAVRGFPLPPGSDPAYRFSAMRGERSGR